MKRISIKKQQGYFLIIAVVLIMVVGVMGTVIAYMFSNRAALSYPQQRGMQVFYSAESGLDIAARLLNMPFIGTTPGRVSCAALTGTSAVTNASLNGGTFTLSTINSSPVYAINTLSGAVTSSATTLPLSSAVGFAPSGRVMIDRELINYAAISGNSLIGVTRGLGGTLASSHASGARVAQYECSVDSQAGIPNLTSPSYKRELQSNVQLQDGWLGANVSGNNFVMSRWNRATELNWNATTLAAGSNAGPIHSMSMISSADGWAVSDNVSTNYVFLRWNGTAWAVNTVASVCNNVDLNGVSMVSSRQGFAVGTRFHPTNCNNGVWRYAIVYYNGSTWTSLSSTTSPAIPADVSGNTIQNLNAVHVIDTNGDGLADIGFAVGNSGTILRYNGTNWVTDSSGVSNNLNAVYVVSASEAWAVGAGGVILRWNGSTWSSFASPVNTALNGIAMLDTNGDGLAEAGWIAANTERILSYNGSAWSFVDLGGSNLFAVDIAALNDVWVAGAGGTLIHWDGSAWTDKTSGVSQQINTLQMISAKSDPMAGWKQVFR